MANDATGACPRCGREVSRGAFYCPGCGGRLREAGVAGPSSPSGAGPVGAGNLRATLGVAAEAPPRQALAEVRGVAAISEIERSLAQALDLDRYGTEWSAPVQLCGTAEEFYSQLLSQEELSSAQLAAWLDAQVKEAKEGARRGGGIWGVYIGGRGCFLNGWLYTKVFGLESAAAALSHPAAFQAMIETAIHEKWGHGFLGATTALGRESAALQTERYRRARTFPLQSVNSPDGVILTEKWGALFGASRYADEGWATWVEQHALRTLNPKHPPKPMLTPSDLLAAGKEGALPSAQALAKALELLVADGTRPVEAQAAMAVWEEAEARIEGSFAGRWGQPPRYLVGYALCSSIAKRFGPRCVPAALAVAYNVTYGIDKHSVADLRDVVTGNPGLNVNQRLAAVAHLPAAGGRASEPAELARAAHDALGYAIPKELRG